MRAPLFALTLFLWRAGTVAQDHRLSPETEAIHRQIEANQAAVGRAIHARDFSALGDLWAPRMVVNAPDNSILTREQVLAAMRRGGLNYTSLQTTAESFQVFGNTAVEMGHEDFVMAAGPQAGKPLQRRYTDIWQRTGSHWVQIARQATILGVEAASVYGPAAPTTPPH